MTRSAIAAGAGVLLLRISVGVAGFLKKHGSVIEGRKAQAETQANTKGARPTSCGSSSTVTQQTAKDLGTDAVNEARP
jgi:hypothetical protein